MRFYPLLSSYVVPVLVLAGLAFTTSHAEDTTPADLKMPAWVKVKSGTEASKVPRSIEPTSFVVDVGEISEKARIPIELGIRNTSTNPIKILGGNSGCSSHGCLIANRMRPSTIQPGDVAKICVLYVAPANGNSSPLPIELDSKIYMGASMTFTIPYRIVGKVLPANSVAASPQAP